MLRTPSDPHFGGLDHAAAPGITAHSTSDTITIPDATLLFGGEYKRAGLDLVLSNGERQFVVHEYFRNGNKQTLLTPDGGRVSADIVEALTGHGDYAQAGAPAQPVLTVVGRVVKFDGYATVIRNGVSVSLHVGDGLLKGDVLQTGTGTMSVTFNDGSTLELSANSRLAVNDFVYNANGTSNSEILDLVRGSLVFVSGEVAHSGGNMSIKTPVATMGIRGTVGTVSNGDDGTVHFSIIESATGAVLLDSQGNVFATITANGPDITVHFQNAQLIAQETQKSPQEILQQQALLQQIIQTQAVGQQILQQFFNQPPNPQSIQTQHTQINIDLTKPPANNGPETGPNNTVTNPPLDNTNINVHVTVNDQNGNVQKVVDLQLPQPQNTPPLDVLTVTPQHGSATDHGQPVTVDLLAGVSSTVSTSFTISNFVGSALLDGQSFDAKTQIEAGGVIFVDSHGNTYREGPNNTYIELTGNQVGQSFASIDIVKLIVDPTKFSFLTAGHTLQLIANYDVSDGILTDHDSATFTIVGLDDASRWDRFIFTGDQAGDHIYAPFPAVNFQQNVIGVLFGLTGPSTDPPSTFTLGGPNDMSLRGTALDPFFLNKIVGEDLVISDGTIFQFPSPYALALPSIDGHDAVGIAVYETQTQDDSGIHRVVREAFITGNDDQLAIADRAQIAGPLDLPTENPFLLSVRGIPNAPGFTSYGLAFDQYDQSTGTYTIYLENFVHTGTGYVSHLDFTKHENTVTFQVPVGSDRTDLPASFYSAAGPDGYLLAYADVIGGQTNIRFQSYNEDGTLGTQFGDQGVLEIAPDLSAYLQYAANAQAIHNQVTLQALDGTLTGLTTPLFLMQPGNSGPIFAAWNDEITIDGDAATYDQVEFVKLENGQARVYFTFQIPDALAQNVKLQGHTGLYEVGGSELIYLAFGDAHDTTIIEFSYNGATHTLTEVGGYTEATPDGQVFSFIRDLGDGRVAIVYDDLLDDNVSSQVVIDVADFRTTGLNLIGSAFHDNYFAGTQFSDTVTGGSGSQNFFIDNFYDFIGSSSGNPTDIFHGGSYAWNEALLPGAFSHYSIEFSNNLLQLNGGSGFVITSHDLQHRGTLTVDDHVQALLFNPSQDPAPVHTPPGSGTATLTIYDGTTLVLLQPTGQNLNVSFVHEGGAPGEFVLYDPSGFGGEISNFGLDGAQSDLIDLATINASFGTFDSLSGVLTLFANANDANPLASLTFAGGTYAAGNFDLAGDGSGGTLITFVSNGNGGDVIAVNHAPTVSVSPVSAPSLTEDSSLLTVFAADLLTAAGATDPDNDQLSIINFTPVSAVDQHNNSISVPDGTLTVELNNDGTFKDFALDPSKFDYLGAGESVTLTAGFDVSDGRGGIVHDTAVATITGVDDAPVLNSVTLTISEGGTVGLTAGDISITDPDSSSFTYTVSNVTHGTFQVDSGSGFVAATSFTSAQLAGGKVRFVHDGGEAAPTFSIKANDGLADSGTIAGTAHFTNVNDAPTFINSPASLTAFDEDTTPSTATVAQLFGSHFSDVDNGASLAGVAINLSSGTPGFEYSLDSGQTWHAIGIGGTGALILSADTLLRFDPAANFNGSASRSVELIDNSYSGSFTTDPNAEVKISIPSGSGTAFSNQGALTVTVNAVDDAPVFAGLGPTATGTEQQASFLDHDATVSDVELDGIRNWTGATLTVQRHNGASSDDVFGIDPSWQTNFTVSGSDLVNGSAHFATFSSVNGVLTINFIAPTINDYSTVVNKVLESITYANSNDAPPASVTIDYAFNDGNTGSQGSGGAKIGTGSVTVNITPVDDAPVLNSVTLTISEGGTVGLTAGDISITDPDSSSFTYTVSNVTHGTFQVDSGSGFVAATSFTSAQLAGGKVRFVHDGGEDAPTFSIKANDGLADSGTIAGTVHFTNVNDAPVVSPSSVVTVEDHFNTQSYGAWTEANDSGGATGGEFQIAHDSTTAAGDLQIRLTDLDSEVGAPDTLSRTIDLSGATSATMTFDYRRDIPNGETNDRFLVLVSTDGTNFTEIGNIGATGNGSFVDANYQTFTFNLTPYISANTTVRFSVGDDVDNGDIVWVDNFNVSYSAGTTYTENGAPIVISPALTVSDVDSANLVGATVTISAGFVAGDILLADTTGTNITASYNPAGVLTLTGTDTLAHYQQVLDSVAFKSTSDNPTDAGAHTSRTISFQINDGSSQNNLSTAATTTVTVSGVNDAPTFYVSAVTTTPSHFVTSTFTTIDPPVSSQQIFAFGIDNLGDIVGTAGANGWKYHNGSFTIPISYPSANSTSTNDINDSGIIVGSYDGQHAFSYNGSVFSPITVQGFTYASAFGINDAGVIVGAAWNVADQESAFVDHNGTITTFAYAGATRTVAEDINERGDIVGWYSDSGGVKHGFVYDGTQFTAVFDFPGATTTEADGINDEGAVVGKYVDGSGVHGFIYGDGVFTTVDDPLGHTEISKINDAGQVVGLYQDSSGSYHAFTAGTVQSTTLTGLAISDADAGNDPLTITAVADHGTLALAQSEPGLTPGQNVPPGTLAGSGTLDAINHMLADGVVYTPNFPLPANDKVSVTINDGHGGSDAVNFIFNVAGQNNVSLTGTNGKDVIYNSSAGSNPGGTTCTMTGNDGSDTFVFRNFSPQTNHNDVVTDFNVNQDFLNFDLGHFADVAHLLAAAATDPSNSANTVITVDAHNTVTINNVSVADLTQHQSHILIV